VNELKLGELCAIIVGEYVAQFLYTVAVLPNGPIKLTGPAGLDTDVYKSDKTIEDEQLRALLASGLRPKKKSKSKKAGDKAEQKQQ
jgi:hypothetical protein